MEDRASVAIIGMACRVPGAASIEEFWDGLAAGRDAITDFSDDDLRAAGVPPQRFADPSYVRSRGVVEGADRFDAAFFGYTPREAALTDPQQRLFLEGAWHALEDAGCIASRPDRRIGVFAGCGMNAYLLNNLACDRALIDSTDYHQLLLAADKDYLATRVSYKLDLTGPSISVATACSTSLVAVHQAAQSILNGECDVALAGGVSIPVPLREGFLIKEDGVLSPHGRCRAFDAAADGIGAGSGYAIVVLARLDDALADRSRIYALLLGSAINNDGALKTGFTAPSVRGQALVISEALAAAGVDPATIGYVEAHGTGTPLGDPIEVAALTQAYRAAGARESQYCAIGSVKTNIGHLDAAAGAIGVIKAALMLHHRRLVPSLHFTSPNPEIDFGRSPFFVNTEMREWVVHTGARRAAISSFGLGGTNAHAILEEAPAVQVLPMPRPFELLLVSAKSDCALARAVAQLETNLGRHPEVAPADVAFTLGRRRHFERRRAFLWETASGRRVDVTEALPNGDERLLALGRGWIAGETIEPELFCSGDDRRIVSLPGYPFEPEPHWIAPRTSAAPVPTTGALAPENTSGEATLEKVRGIVAGVTGIPLGTIEESSDVFDLGLDSLALIQVNRALKDQLGVTLPLSELLTDLSVVGALAARVAAELAAQVPEPVQASDEPRVGPPPNAEPAAAPRDEHPVDAREAIIAQQLEIMRMQLAVLGAPAQRPAAQPIAPNVEQRSPSGATAKRKPLGFASRFEPAAGPADEHAEARLGALVRRYNARTRRSKEYAARYRDALADSRASVGFRRAVKEMLYPIVGARGKGSRIWDIDGNEYVDLTCGFGVVLFGHHPDFIDAALAEDGNDPLLLGPRSPYAGEAAALIADLTGMPRVAFCNSGTEAVMAAIRLARARTGRSRIVTFEGSYHGHSDQTLAQSTLRDGVLFSEGIAPGIPPEAIAATTVLEYGSESSLEYIRKHAGELAAVLVEPVQNMRLDLEPPVEFLHELRAITERAGTALLFDEMITGFRLHPAGAQGYFGIHADLATYGKVIAGGMPIGVVAGNAEFLDGIDGGTWRYGDDSSPSAQRTFFGGTFCQHPATMIAAVATLREIKRRGPQLQTELNARTTALATRLNGYFTREELPLRVAHFGSAFRINVPSAFDLLWYHLIERGVYVWEWRGCFLSTAHTNADLDQVMQAIEGSIDALRGDEPSRHVETVEAVAAPEFALTQAQRQLLALSEVHPNGALAYNMGFALMVHGELDRERLESAVAKLVDRHEALRTVLTPGGDAQRVLPSLSVPVEVIDFSDFDGDERERRLAGWFSSKNAAPVRLDRGPLVTVHLLRLGAARHILVMTAHHCVSDGWSMASIVGELFALYEGRALDPTLQYRDYVAWQQRFARSDEYARQEAFWVERLGAPLPVLALPFDRPRPVERDYRAARASFTLPAGETRAIKNFCAKQRCTLFIGLYAAYTALIHRIVDQRDLLVGIPVAGRGLEGGDSLVGYCTHVLPVRLDVDPDASFSDHLQATKTTLAQAYEYQDYPFAALLERLQLGRDKSRLPLVSATFNLDKPTAVPTPVGLRLELYSHPVDFSDLELMLNVIDLGDELVVDCDYSSELFDAVTAERLLESYRTLLAAAVDDPAQRVARLPVLGPQERAALAVLDGIEGGPTLECVHESFERQAAKRPDAVALVDGDERLTYRELNERSNAIAHTLVGIGVGRGARVAVCLEPSAELIAALLGVLKSGAAYVPIDPAFPPERIAALIGDAQPGATIANERLRSILPPSVDRVELILDGDRPKIEAQSRENPNVAVGLDQTAYVIYTSGSTGKPKGVLVAHDNVARLFAITQRDFQFDVSDTWTLFHSFAFDFSVWEIFGALVHGGRLVVVPYWLARDPAAFYSLLCEHGVTVLNQTPSAFRQLDAAEAAAGSDPRLRLRLVIFGGEALEPASLAAWFWRHGDERPRLVNMYGITETTVHVTYRALDVAYASQSASRIGRPLADLRAHVLDRWLQPVARGVVGELYVGGAGVARGYLNNEALTRERFIPSPFHAGERLYRSGDLVRWSNDGELEYLGRADQQLKVRGFRIEPGEIESVLRSHPQVRDAVVVLRDSAPGSAQLVAYVVGDASPASLRELVARKLPDYMLPAAFVSIDAVPLTRNGKLDRTALPDPQRHCDALGVDAPENPIEAQLAAIWAELLGCERVGIHDNFFEIGGDSIVGMQVAARALGVGLKLSLRDIHRYPTVAALARIAIGAEAQAADASPAEDPPKLVPIQRWFFAQRQPEPHHHHIALVLEVQPGTRAAMLERSLDAVIALHPALRTGFGQDENPFVVASAPRSRVATYDLRGRDEGGRKAEIDRVREEFGASTRLDEPPLLRAALFDCGPQVLPRLLLSVHHLVIDGVSTRILLDDLQSAYAQIERGADPVLAPPTASPQAWAEALERAVTEGAFEEERAGWAGSAELALLPRDLDGTTGDDSYANEAHAVVQLDTVETAAFVARAVDARADDLILGATVAALGRWLGDRALAIDLESHGREPVGDRSPDLTRSIGWFTSFSSVRVGLRREGTAATALREVQIARAGGSRNGSGHLAVGGGILFNYLGNVRLARADGFVIGLANENGGRGSSLRNRRSHLLELNAYIADDELRLDVAYPASAQAAATIERLCGDLAAALRELIGATPGPDAEPPRTAPASFGQERLWFLDRLEGESTAYHAQGALLLEGDLRTDVLRASLDEIVRRHEVLRTTFRWSGDRLLQTVGPPMSVPYAEIDLRTSGTDVQTEATAQNREPFDLEHGPLLRVALLRSAEREAILVLTIHHIVTDGWSRGIFFKELTALYSAYLQGKPSPLAPLSRQYADYAERQRSESDAGQWSDSVAYWRAQLGSAPELSTFSSDRPRAGAAWRGAICELDLPAELSAAIVRLGRTRNATTFMVLLSALSLLVARLNGRSDVVIGAPSAHRDRPELEPMIGFFVNALALRSDLSQNPTFVELLDRVREVAVEAYAHQDIPFEKIVEAVAPRRDTAHTPLFQVFFNMQNVPEGRLELSGLRVSEYPVAQLVNRFDVTLYAVQDRDRLRFELVYNACIFDREPIERNLEQLRFLLEQAVARPDSRIEDYSLVREGDRAVLPSPAVSIAQAEHGLLHDGFLHAAARSPQALAIVDSASAWTYGETDAFSGRIARWLLHAGCHPGDVVAVVAPASAVLVASVIGALRAGGTFMIVDPATPPFRVSAMLEAARPAFLLRTGDGAPCVSFEGRRLEIKARTPDALLDIPGNGSSFVAAAAVLPNQPAYVAFTSGSTGAPLGIRSSHAPVSHFLSWHIATFGLQSDDRFSLLSGVAHDPALRDIFTPLWLGASLHVPASDVRESPEALARWLAGERISIAHVTPPLAQLVLADDGETPFPSLRRVFFGGDRLTYATVRALRRRAPGCRFVNFYGTTETPQAMSFQAIEPREIEVRPPEATVPVGRGIDGVQLLVQNGERLCGIGEPGEICVRTPYLSDGYLEGDRNAGRFGDRDGVRCYRTGDLGIYNADGGVEILGRNDAQAKIRGYRVEPREIEAVLGAHPAVSRCYASAIERHGVTELVTFVVAADVEFAAAACRRWLGERLPEHLVPAKILFVDQLPLTPNGKIDRAALLAEAHAATGRSQPRALDGPVERALAKIWAEVLDRHESIGADDDFFALGGHSLNAVRVLSRIARDLHVSVPLRALFEHPRLRDLASALASAAPESQVPLVPVEKTELYAASHAQRRLWSLVRLGTSAAYNLPSALMLEGTLDRDAFERALGTVIARHEALRTTFSMLDGELRQRILPPESFPLVTVDLRGEDDPLEAARALAESDASTEFALEKAPPIRFSLLQIADDRAILLFNAHHIVADGWSIGVLIREVVACYDAARRGSSPDLPQLRVQYKDYAAWQARELAGERGRRDLQFWRETLALPLPVVDLPADFVRPLRRSTAGGRVPIRFDAPLANALERIAHEHDATLYMVLLALVKVMLFRLSGERDLIVGSPVAGRNHVDLENQVGLYVNMLALRDRLDPSAPFVEYLASVVQTTRAAFEHQEYPFDRLVAELALPRDVTRTPVFDVVVTLQDPGAPEFRLDGLRIARFEVAQTTSKFDCTFVFERRDDGLYGYLEYNADLFLPERVQRIVLQLEELARSVAAAPERPLSALNILPAEERARVCNVFNATEAAYPAERSLVDLFEEQAGAHPAAPAVQCEGRELTYGQLDAGANRLARKLCEAGVGPNELVAVMMERSELVPLALLAVLKTGAAYVPIDPSYPPERIAFTLEDAGCRVMLADRERCALWCDRFVGALLEVEAGLAAPGTAPRVSISPDDAAYVIYTSGSTGQPKGCIVTHRNVMRLLKNEKIPFDFSARDVWAMTHSPAFDFSVWEMYGALLYGGRLVIVPREISRDPQALRAFVRRYEISVLNQTPAAFYGFIDAERKAPHHDLARHLRYVIFGGDRLAPAQLRDWIALYPLDRVQLVNMYGITETTVHVTFGRLQHDDIFGETGASPIGVPLPETFVYVCDPYMNPQPIGVPGELYIGGTGVCRGYIGRPELTAQRFVPSPFRPGERLYRSGDLGLWRTDGTLVYLGRNDRQIQIRGYRVELDEIRNALEAHPSVREAVVAPWLPADDPRDAEKRIVAWVVRAPEVAGPDLRVHLRATLPEFMIPSHLLDVARIPLGPNGKPEVSALPVPQATIRTLPAPNESVATRIAGIWRTVLRCDAVGLDDNFFDIGGHSLLLIEVHRRLTEWRGEDVPLVELFRYPTVRALAEYLEHSSTPAIPTIVAPAATAEDAIAIVGLAGRFPGADGIDRFWRNLCEGIESNVRLSDDELIAAGVPAQLVSDPRYVRNKPVLAAIDEFDADFFGIPSREATIMDPQHRLFLECAWEAFENAGYDPAAYAGRVGVFAAASINSYLLTNLFGNKDLIESLGVYPLLIGNDRDFLATRVSYKLNLKGPALVVGTACSGSMVAVHLAAQSLRAGECEMALAGGVSVKVPQHEGYLYDEGGILSPDGHCRAFDALANGTVGGSGAGIAVLKRLRDALRDRDHVYAVIRGIATGNDGSEKVGYTAPSIAGQAEVIARAQALAGVNPESIGFVEAHGTGTSLGDPIEIAALTQAFRAGTERAGFCAIGSVKTNIGHLDAAAGIAGLIKAALALDRRELPPSLNCEEPNPKAGFAESPFFVNTRLRTWERTSTPRRAGVSSFGLGGTNVHAILEETPEATASPAQRALQLVQLSAPTPRRLDALAQNLAAAFEARPDIDLADAAYTLAVGRRAFEHRLVLTAAEPLEAAQKLRARDPRVVHLMRAVEDRPVAFMFPGGGAQYVEMGRDLYEREPAFRDAFDRCAESLIGHAGRDLRDALFVRSDETEMRGPAIGLPALFAVEYALAQLLLAYGVAPRSMIGHSLGEYVAAVLAGTFTLDDALALVALRGRLFERIGSGAMLSVALAESELAPLLEQKLSIAAVNLPQACVVSGPVAEIERFAVQLEARGVDCRRVSIDTAAHSVLVEPILDEFRRFLGGLKLTEPAIPFVSNVTGTWIRGEQATSPEYWTMHMRRSVRFADGIRELIRDPRTLLLEVGPGNTLASLAQRHPDRSNEQPVLRTMRRRDEPMQPDDAIFSIALGRLWGEGVPIDTRVRYPAERRRVPLPGLVFERKRYWIDPPKVSARSDVYAKRAGVAEWFYVPSPRRSVLARRATAPSSWLVVRDASGVGERVAERLRAGGHVVAIARPGDLLPAGPLPGHILYAAALDGTQHLEPLLALARECVQHPGNQGVDLCVLTESGQDVGGEAWLDPDAAAFIGPVLVIGQEQDRIRCRAIDLQVDADAARVADDVAAELLADPPQTLVAYRAGHRWTRGYAPIELELSQTRLRENGVYLITGGTGGVGVLIATFLARAYRARLGLFARDPTRLDAATLEQIGALGGEVVTIPGDVGELADLQRGVAAMRARYGALHGVIHAAGATTGASIFQPFDALPPGAFAEQAHPKLRGAQILAEALEGEALDFVLSISSNAALLGGLGLTTYAAASASLDLFSVAHGRDSAVPWISAGWDGWPTARRQSLAASEQTSLDRIAMSVPECEEALRLVLAAPPGHVVVSSANLEARLARWTTYERTFEDETSVQAQEEVLAPAARPEELADPLARAIARLWCEMLGLQRVGLYESFFELRGDSLLGSRMITRLGVMLGLRIPLRTLFEAPTVAGLVERIAAIRNEAGNPPPESLPIPRVSDRDAYPLSHAQRRLWLLAHADGGSRAYHIALSLRLDGELDRKALADAVACIGERHESLRTSFHQTDGEPVQRVHRRAAWSLEFADLSHEVDSESNAERTSHELIDAPFDLESGALVRFRLLRIAPARHEFVMVMHHIVSDGWSLSVLARELGALYDALRRGETQPLAPLRINYRDYAAWAGGGLEEDRRYWLDRLAGPLPVVSFPTDYPRPVVRGFRGANVSFAFDVAERRALERLAHDHSASLFMVLCALVKVLIFRYTGARDIVVGTPVAGRRHPDLDDQIGFYLNTVVLRDEIDSDASFAKFLRQVRQTAVDAYAHDGYPFDELVDAIGGSRDASRSPLFDVQVSMQNAGSLKLAFDGIVITPRALETGESKCDLSFDFDGSEEVLLAGIRYDSALFAPATVGRLAEHLRALARSAAADPSVASARLEILSERERAAILETIEGPGLELPSETLLDRFAAQVARIPGRVAARFAGESLTYRELDERSNRIANFLQARALGREAIVGVCLERSLELLAVLLGVLKAGCAYVPIDPSYPDERIALMLQNAGVKLVLARGAAWERMQAVVPDGCALVALDADAAAWHASNAKPLGVRVQPGDLAYVLFTSGSTGIPKGVEIEHRALYNFLRSMESAPGIGSDDVLLAVTTISFDIAGLELYLPLFAGAQVVIAETDLARDGKRLSERLDAGDISVMQATPATWSMLLASGWQGRRGLKVLCGGEALTGTLARELRGRCAELWNLYGPTETTIWSALHRVREEDCGSAHVTLGRPINNTRIAILDGSLQPVPVGVAGDLFIGGFGVARGYRGQSELTAERFIADPFASVGAARMYKTGDLARFTPEGTIAFLGRSDQQVKVRGHRIELDEVEAALLRAPAVREAVVNCVVDGRGEPALCAYVVPRDHGVDVGALRLHLAAILPAYMVPSAFVELEALPLGPSGKVNRAVLPPPEEIVRERSVPPRTALEASIAKIWCRVLEIDDLGVEDDFFELGGHSLKATHIVFAIQEELGFSVTLTDVFRHPSVEALARALDSRLAASAESPRDLALSNLDV